jgi:antirestriction protein ArdC
MEIGDGIIKLKIPMVNKSLVFNSEDIEGLKEALTSKS